jgi:hypothetical protein
MRDARCAMRDGRWAMGDGRWAMGDAQWAMRNGRFITGRKSCPCAIALGKARI